MPPLAMYYNGKGVGWRPWVKFVRLPTNSGSLKYLENVRFSTTGIMRFEYETSVGSHFLTPWARKMRFAALVQKLDVVSESHWFSFQFLVACTWARSTSRLMRLSLRPRALGGLALWGEKRKKGEGEGKKREKWRKNEKREGKKRRGKKKREEERGRWQKRKKRRVKRRRIGRRKKKLTSF